MENTFCCCFLCHYVLFPLFFVIIRTINDKTLRTTLPTYERTTPKAPPSSLLPIIFITHLRHSQTQNLILHKKLSSESHAFVSFSLLFGDDVIGFILSSHTRLISFLLTRLCFLLPLTTYCKFNSAHILCVRILALKPFGITWSY